MKFELHYNGRKYPVVPAKVEDETPPLATVFSIQTDNPAVAEAFNAIVNAYHQAHPEIDDANSPNR